MLADMMIDKAARFRVAKLPVALSCCLVTACADMEQRDQWLAAAGGATLGCLSGLAIGRSAKDCAIGAAAGAVVAWGAVKLSQYHSTQVRSVKKDQEIYGLRQSDVTQVNIRESSAMPANVRPGNTVKITTDYSLVLPQTGRGKTTDVQESWLLKKDGKTLAEVPPQRNRRSAGGWVANASIPIPKNAAPGTYIVETKVKAGDSNDVSQATFDVSS